MNIHAFLDETALAIGSLFAKKYFRKSITSPPFAAHVRGVKLDMPAIRGEGDYVVPAQTLAGELNAAFRITQWLGADYPTIICHHGAGEIPFDFGFSRIFPYDERRIDANLAAIRAPFHRSRDEFFANNHSLANWIAMLAVSVHLVEHLVSYSQQQGTARTVVAGTSLGGFISNLHHIHFNSAAMYAPILGGAYMAHVTLDSVYSKGVASLAKRSPAAIREILDFEPEFVARDNSNVFPLLARFDQIVLFDRHSRTYGEQPIGIMNRGHVTGALSFGRVRRHILSLVD
ncbi:MAG: hypothetical protein MAG451_00256 [Anaerolineales bacterium]|nr:hypothetical protein [Anaerolineales bacterium]